MLVIGSRAFDKLRGITRPDDEFQDWDLICTWAEFEAMKDSNFYAWHDHFNFRGEILCRPTDRGKKWIATKPHKYVEYQMVIEAEIAWPGSVAEQILLATDSHPSQIPEPDSGDFMTDLFHGVIYADLNTSYALKMSHRFLKDSPHFAKTRDDIKLMRTMGATLDGVNWYNDRVDETYWYEHPNLDRSKDEFFGPDAASYAYDHDTLHEIVAVEDGIPAYTYYLKDGSDVLCDKSKWEALPYERKLAGVYEEASVLALERSVVPYGTDPDEAFRFALQKTVTSITSGWFRDFGWEYFDELLDFHEALGKDRILDRLREKSPPVIHAEALNAVT